MMLMIAEAKLEKETLNDIQTNVAWKRTNVPWKQTNGAQKEI